MIVCPVCRYENKPGSCFCTHCGVELSNPPLRIGQLIVLSEPVKPQHERRRELPCSHQGVERRKGHRLIARTLFIGRHPSNDIVVQDNLASLRHARITRSGDTFWIEDLGSTNGTYVNGEWITQKQRLTDKDLLQIGTTILEFQERIQEQDG